jgi:hypothetical protein
MSIAHIVLVAVWSGAVPSQVEAVQQPHTDRLQATSLCLQQVAKVGPAIVKWQKSELVKGTKEPPKEPVGTEWTFIGHYNGEMQRCLIEVEVTMPDQTPERTSEKPLAIGSWIYDAFEGGRLIAKVFSIRDPKDPKAVLITTCDIFQEPKSERDCRALMQR